MDAVVMRLTAIGMLPALLVVVGGRELFAVAFGRQWAEAGVYAQMLGLWMLVWFTSAPLGAVFIALERQELALIGNIVMLVSRVGALMIGGLVGSERLAVGMFAASGVVMYAWLGCWSIRLAGGSVRAACQGIGAWGVRCSVVVAIVLGLKLWGVEPWVITVVSVSMLAVYMPLAVGRDVRQSLLGRW